MRASTLLLGTVLVGGTLAAGAATLSKAGVAPAEEPQGISLRQESTRHHGHGFFYACAARTMERSGPRTRGGRSDLRMGPRLRETARTAGAESSGTGTGTGRGTDHPPGTR